MLPHNITLYLNIAEDMSHLFDNETHQAELRMTAAWKIGWRLPLFILAARGLDKLINMVFMLNLDTIWLLDDKSKLPLFALSAASEEHIGKIMILFFCIKI